MKRLFTQKGQFSKEGINLAQRLDKLVDPLVDELLAKYDRCDVEVMLNHVVSYRIVMSALGLNPKKRKKKVKG